MQRLAAEEAEAAREETEAALAAARADLALELDGAHRAERDAVERADSLEAACRPRTRTWRRPRQRRRRRRRRLDLSAVAVAHSCNREVTFV